MRWVRRTVPRSEAGSIPMPHLRPATRADLPRIYEIRHGTSENPLTDPTLVTDEEVAWYMDEALFLVSEDAGGVQGFVCANHQTGYVWALFVIDAAQGRGHGTALLDAALGRLARLGHRQAFLTTDADTRAAGFYRARGWRCTGTDLRGEAVFVRALSVDPRHADREFGRTDRANENGGRRRTPRFRDWLPGPDSNQRPIG